MQQEITTRRVLCLWLQNWPIQRLIVAQPELKCRRIALFRQDSRRGQLVAAASPLAQRAGVQLAMPLSEAKSLLSRSARNLKGTDRTGPDSAKHSTGRSEKRNLPSLQNKNDPLFHILPHDPAADLFAIEKLVDDLDGFSPIIGLQQETDHPDCIFLDTTGLASLFGDEFKLAAGVEEFCQRQGYLVRVAIANNVALAQAMAQFQCGMRNAECGTSSISVTSADDAIACHALPIAALRLNDWTTETLNQLGVRYIGQLLQLPRRDLSARFGNEIHRRIDQMTGKISEPVIARQAAPEFYAEQLLDYPTSHKETIEVIIERLIAKICTQLSAAQQGALQWTVRLYCQQKLPLKLYISLFQPTATTEDVIQLAKMQLDQMLSKHLLKGSGTICAKHPSGRSGKWCLTPLINAQLAPDPFNTFEVNEINVTVTSCVLLTHRQRKLFDESPRLDRQALAQLINRLSGRLGRQNVVYPSIVSGAQPEHAFKMRPLVDPYSRGPRRTVTENRKFTSQSHVMARPLKIFQPSIALQTVALSENSRTEPATPPALLICSANHHTIINHWGPERIETGWWRGPTTRRDYWRVETESHQQFWIYHDLRKRTWFLHGEF